MKNPSSILLCDLACRKYTGISLPDLPMYIISYNLDSMMRKNNKMKKPKKEISEFDENIVIKGARKKKWAKCVLTKYRMKKAFKFR